MRMLLSLIFLLGLSSVQAQDVKPQDDSKNKTIIQSFIADLADNNKAIDVILSQHVLVQHPSDELYDYLEASLMEIRINLMTKRIEDIAYTPYSNMPPKEIRDVDPEGLCTHNMYFLHHKKRQMLAVYVEEGKIGSFTLVSKGGNKAHFVRY
ncbi:hypothetical protein G5B30_00470 [Sphingobacterium sp. SGG-5]|uniref:hypothetical protein n=1 Tax=Sphingobacterium sp. SGG-5 TaxID=2710881 RepID=UPI0013EB1557|nr:hypothetical protein [Sphingobacterium sp. SGG-5]NGM60377.1 hypothetical protein [Sphingobacterium sp. SGG-5]